MTTDDDATCPDLTGHSAAMQALRQVIERIAPSLANVLILGETGTGKEVAAKTIHHQSGNRGGPFVPINCSAIPADLLESELFGHRKGTFTGAINDRVGRFELAAGGTLFLDEIGDMPTVLQVKLLRVLEERVIYPLGSDSAVPVTARLIAATHRNLDDLVQKGEFREDLYYRLNVVPVTIPPLRERVEDIPLLLKTMCHRILEDNQASVDFADSAMDALTLYPWPGNVRELLNLVERLTVLHPNGIVEVADLPPHIRGIPPGEEQDPDSPEIPQSLVHREDFDLKEHMRLTETEMIQQALLASDGVISKAAKILQVRRTTLAEKVKRLGLNVMVK